MSNTEEISEWVSPIEALEMLEPRYGAHTKLLIADKLLDGLITARANLVWDSDEPNLGEAIKNREETIALGEEANVHRDYIVEKEVWRQSRHWYSDVSLWRWDDNRFLVTYCQSPVDRTILEGLSFYKKDIQLFTKPASKRGGRKPKYKGWADVSFALLKVERQGDLTREKFPHRASLEKRLMDEVAELGASPANTLESESIRRCAHAIWDRLFKETPVNEGW